MNRAVRLSAFLLALLTLSASVRAHFVFIVPEPDGKTALVVLSEDLDPDDRIPPQLLAGAAVNLRDASGRITPLEKTKGELAWNVALPGEGLRVAYGSVDLGVRAPEGEGAADKPSYRLIYLPKTILGDAFAASATLGEKMPAEIVPVGAAGRVKFRVLTNGKPAAKVGINVITPDGNQKEFQTDSQGESPAFQQVGRYGVWARCITVEAGEFDGKPFDELRHYPTLVATIGSSAAHAHAPAKTDAIDTPLTDTERFAVMPEQVSSMGAVVSNGWLYVFGGHRAKTHSYHVEAVTERFYRLDLSNASSWQGLPHGPRVQGLNIAAHGGVIYRAGGMNPRNEPFEKADNYSIDDVAQFRPRSSHWEPLPDLPQPRSSHDIVVANNKLIIVGGWNMRGRERGNDWHTTALTLDLSDDDAQWQSIDQPFTRRALIAAVLDGKVYVIGGMTDDNEVSNEVDILDTAGMTWSTGPELPAGRFNGFSSAAAVHDGRLYVSVADGSLLRLTQSGDAWEQVGRLKPRVAHRMVSHGSKLLVVGGAWDGHNFDVIEALSPASSGTVIDAAQPAAPAHARPTPHRNLKDGKQGADPDAMKASTDRAKPTATRTLVPATGQTCCPVMTTVEVSPDDAISLSYNGVEVLVCCSKCEAKFNADPEAYLLPSLLPQLSGIDLPERGIEQMYCPVYPTRVVSSKDPYVEYEGRKVYLFNQLAVRRWNADPSRYLNATILPQLRDVIER